MENNELTFEKVWLMFQETDKKFQETDKKFQETDKRIEKLSKETDKKLRKLETLFTGNWGKLIESLIEGNLAEVFQERNIDVKGTSQRVKKIFQDNEIEFDILAMNGKDIVAVEVKTTLLVEHVRTFVNKLKIFKEVFPEYKDKNVYGAMAFLKIEEQADKFAYREGLFVIKANAKHATILNNKSFQPKIW